ncbi:hypothetical protein G6F24_015641 [Rhizopus arrhizus]|nr:hypothetical protein G6F24_015641 [Rhizopus arrhizus]
MRTRLAARAAPCSTPPSTVPFRAAPAVDPSVLLEPVEEPGGVDLEVLRCVGYAHRAGRTAEPLQGLDLRRLLADDQLQRLILLDLISSQPQCIRQIPVHQARSEFRAELGNNNEAVALVDEVNAHGPRPSASVGGFLRWSKPDDPLLAEALDGPLHVVVSGLDQRRNLAAAHRQDRALLDDCNL